MSDPLVVDNLRQTIKFARMMLKDMESLKKKNFSKETEQQTTDVCMDMWAIQKAFHNRHFKKC